MHTHKYYLRHLNMSMRTLRIDGIFSQVMSHALNYVVIEARQHAGMRRSFWRNMDLPQPATYYQRRCSTFAQFRRGMHVTHGMIGSDSVPPRLDHVISILMCTVHIACAGSNLFRLIQCNSFSGPSARSRQQLHHQRQLY